MRGGEWWLLVETTSTQAGRLSGRVKGVGNGRHRVLVVIPDRWDAGGAGVGHAHLALP